MATGSEIATGSNTTDIDGNSQRLPRKMWVYSYRQFYESPCDLEARIFLNSDFQVAFQAGGKELTAWHGHWSCTGRMYPKMELAFARDGDEANAKELVVYQCPEGTCIGKKEFWASREGRFGFVNMVLLETYEQCTETNLWKQV